MDFFNSFSLLGLHEWDSVPNRSDGGSFSCLVCVLLSVFVGAASVRQPVMFERQKLR